jgi:hypothetical protein
MAQLKSKFNASEHDTTQNKNGGFTDLPTGIVLAQIEASEANDTDAGGFGVKFTAEIREPEEVAGRKLFGYYYLQNPDGTAAFGAEGFASLVRATGQGPEISDTEEIHFFPFTCRLGWSNIQYEKTGKAFRLDSDGNKILKREASIEIKEFFFDKDLDGNDLDVPAPALDDPQIPKPIPVGGAKPAANDNKPAGASTARSTQNGGAAATAPAAKKNPWTKPKAA